MNIITDDSSSSLSYSTSSSVSGYPQTTYDIWVYCKDCHFYKKSWCEKQKAHVARKGRCPEWVQRHR